MINSVRIKDNEILVVAEGSTNRNRIKNIIIWKLNSMLSLKYNLFQFFISKRSNDDYSFPFSIGLHQRFIVFKELDKLFIEKQTVSETDILQYKQAIDPKNKISDDVFYEMCCLENVDIEYVAIKSLKEFSNISLKFKNKKFFQEWIESEFPVYVSLFSSREVKIVVNDDTIFNDIVLLVKDNI